MDLRPNRERIIEALTLAGIPFPEQATISQLRSLYNSISGELPDNQIDSLNSDVDVIPAEVCLTMRSDSNADSAGNVQTAVNNTSENNSAVNNTDLHCDAGNGDSASNDCTANMLHYSSGVNLSNTPLISHQSVEEQLTDQLKILRMRCEIQDLQRQLQSMENVCQTSDPRRIKYEELEAVVQKFSGQDHLDVSKWVKNFEEYANMCGFNENECLFGVKWLLVGTARQYMHNLNTTSYIDLKKALIKTFKRTVSREEVYRQLRLRTLKPNETSVSYVIAMQTIAAQSNICR